MPCPMPQNLYNAVPRLCVYRNIYDKNKSQNKVKKEIEENKTNIYNNYLRELRDNLSYTEKHIKEYVTNTESLEKRRISIVKQFNNIQRTIHSDNINVDKSLLDDKLYRMVIIESIKEWFTKVDDIKKKEWKKNMKKDVKEVWSDYDLNILTRIKRSEFTID